MTKTTLYERIGDEAIQAAITEFYRRAVTDGIIGHFFFGKDVGDITRKQIDFATAMLGGPRRYQGKPLGPVHAGLRIAVPHFGRRQMLMREVLDEMGMEAELREAWMKLEEGLRPLILGLEMPSCSGDTSPISK